MESDGRYNDVESSSEETAMSSSDGTLSSGASSQEGLAATDERFGSRMLARMGRWICTMAR